MAASESKLSKLHEKLAEVMAEALDGQVTEYQDDEGDTQTMKIAPSAAVMTVVAAFLKNNNITSQPSDDNGLGKLQDKMAEVRNRRTAVTSADLAEATKDAEFMRGLN